MGDELLVDSNSAGMVLSADGATATCQGIMFSTDAWAGALLDGGCEDALTARGYKQPSCNDTRGCGCSAGAGAGAGALLALAALLRRWRAR